MMATTSLQLELQLLQEQLAAKTRALFSPSSERRRRTAPRPTRVPRPPARGHGPRAQATLPLVEIVHTRRDAAAHSACSAADALTLGRTRPKMRRRSTSSSGPSASSAIAGRNTAASAADASRPRRARRSSRPAAATRSPSPSAWRSAKYCRSSAARPAGEADGAGGPHGRHADALGPARSRSAQHLTPTHDALLAAVLTAPVLGADETTLAAASSQPGRRSGRCGRSAGPTPSYVSPARHAVAEACATVLRDYRGICCATAIRPTGRSPSAGRR